MVSEAVQADLRAIVGDSGVISDPVRLMVYESDGLTAYRRAPQAVVLPRSTEEVQKVLRLLQRSGTPFVPRGAGTGLSGGCLAGPDTYVVGTARMNRILSIDPENRTARVQPGVVNAHLTDATRRHGLYYAPDPSSQSTCTLGGNVAENSGGPHCLKYGVTSRYVTGLTVALPSGQLVELGGFGQPRDLDLVGLFVGSEGNFGIATEIETRLLPLPESVRTLLAIFDRMEDAGRAVTTIIAEGLLPAALEIIDGPTIRAVEASVFAAGYPVDAGAALVIEFDGIEAGLERESELARRCCEESGATDVSVARSEEERTALWHGRKKAFGAMGRIAPDLLVQDATVPRTRLPEVLLYPLFKPLIEDHLDHLVPGRNRYVAHPDADTDIAELGDAAADGPAPFTVALGPERGFIDFEVQALAMLGFTPVRAGQHPLRVETALAYVTGQLELMRRRARR